MVRERELNQPHGEEETFQQSRPARRKSEGAQVSLELNITNIKGALSNAQAR